MNSLSVLKNIEEEDWFMLNLKNSKTIKTIDWYFWFLNI